MADFGSRIIHGLRAVCFIIVIIIVGFGSLFCANNKNMRCILNGQLGQIHPLWAGHIDPINRDRPSSRGHINREGKP